MKNRFKSWTNIWYQRVKNCSHFWQLPHPSQGNQSKSKKVKFCYLPSNAISKLQLLYQGVIKSFKVEYRQRKMWKLSLHLRTMNLFLRSTCKKTYQILPRHRNMILHIALFVTVLMKLDSLWVMKIWQVRRTMKTSS